MSSYVLLAIQVPLGMEEALNTGDKMREDLMALPWVEGAFLLNTIPAPGGDT